jgi:PPK2 family polyphosphate:nucleotide phosphotransferase
MKLAYKVKPGDRLKFSDLDPTSKGEFVDKKDPAAVKQLEKDLDRLSDLQELLYADQSQALLVIFQAMDTAGKDGVLRRVVGPLDSRGVFVKSFKAPNADELAHDYLWRAHQHVPRRGEIGFFNRSYYEDVLVVRVMELVDKSRWKRRFDHILAFERMLTDERIRVIKFFLHISKDEQKRRLQERLDDPDKRWKFEPRDLEARKHWDQYVEAYEEAIGRTATPDAPWYIVPADRKWVRDLAVARVLVETLEEMNPRPPKVDIDPSRVTIPD